MLMFEIDSEYVAEQVRFMRDILGWSQEALALAARVSTRTIEKVESGRHTPNEQTLKQIAAAAGFEMAVFRKPSPEEKAKSRVHMERALRKTDVVTISPIVAASDFLSTFRANHACRFDSSEVVGNEPMRVAAEMQDWIEDVMLAWSDLSATQQLDLAEEFIRMAGQIRKHGFVCFGGSHEEAFRTGAERLKMRVGVLCLIPEGRERETEYAVVRMEGPWERAN